jgi:hypothetical protein
MKISSSLSLLLLLIGCGQTPAGDADLNSSTVDYDVAGKSAVVYTTAESTALRLVPTDPPVFPGIRTHIGREDICFRMNPTPRGGNTISLSALPPVEVSSLPHSIQTVVF